MLKKKSILIIKIKIMKTVSNEANRKGIRNRKIGNTVSQGYIEEQHLAIVIAMLKNKKVNNNNNDDDKSVSNEVNHKDY